MTPPAPSLHRRRHFLLAACVISWLGALLATHTPPSRLPGFLEGLGVPDYSLHCVGFFVLGVLFWLVLRAYRVRDRYRAAVTVLALIIYAALDEHTQPWFQRSAALSDWLADTIGTLVAVGVCELLARLARRLGRP